MRPATGVLLAVLAMAGAGMTVPQPAHGLDAGDFGLTSRQPGLGAALERDRGRPAYPAVNYYPSYWYNAPFQFRRTPPDLRDRPRIYCGLGQEGCAN